MTLNELKAIEEILKENKREKNRAKVKFKEAMRRKYKEDWFESKMSVDEATIYVELTQKADEAFSVYDSFVKHDWR